MSSLIEDGPIRRRLREVEPSAFGWHFHPIARRFGYQSQQLETEPEATTARPVVVPDPLPLGYAQRVNQAMFTLDGLLDSVHSRTLAEVGRDFFRDPAAGKWEEEYYATREKVRDVNNSLVVFGRNSQSIVSQWYRFRARG